MRYTLHRICTASTQYFRNSASLNNRSKTRYICIYTYYEFHVPCTLVTIHRWMSPYAAKASSCNVTKGRRTMTNESLYAARIMPARSALRSRWAHRPSRLPFSTCFFVQMLFHLITLCRVDYTLSKVNKFNNPIAARISYFLLEIQAKYPSILTFVLNNKVIMWAKRIIIAQIIEYIFTFIKLNVLIGIYVKLMKSRMAEQFARTL